MSQEEVPDPEDQRTLDHIAQYGWSCIAIDEDEHGPAFAYTVGMMASLRHAEIILFGLPTRQMHAILDALAGDIRGGRTFDAGGLYEGVLARLAIRIRAVHPSWHTEYLGYALWHRRHVGQPGTLEAVQCVWPDKDGRFPWEEGCAAGIVRAQPDLSATRTDEEG